MHVAFALLVSSASFFFVRTNYAFGEEPPLTPAMSTISNMVSLIETRNETFLWYAPHSGFGNQLVAFRNALRLAGILNRTLIIPPILSHNELSYGDCARESVLSPFQSRSMFWKNLLKKIESEYYISMADAIDLSLISNDLIQTIDARLYLSTKCGIDVSKSMARCSWCKHLLPELKKVRSKFDPMTEEQRKNYCASTLGVGVNGDGFVEVEDRSVFLVNKDCKSTIFMYSRNNKTGQLSNEWDLASSPQATCQQGKPTYSNRMAMNHSLATRLKHNFKPPQPVNVVELIGDSKADVVSFGSLFYFFDFSMPMGDARADEISCVTEFLSLSQTVMDAAKNYARNNISEPYACLHFRGGDAFYVNLQEQTLAEAIADLSEMKKRSGPNSTVPLTLFLMSDLRDVTWQSRFNNSFSPLGFKIKFPYNLEELEYQMKLKTLRDGRGIMTNRLSTRDQEWIIAQLGEKKTSVEIEGLYFNNCGLLLEQAICSCASIGFVGNHISSISRSIHHLRNGGVCKLAQPSGT